jgi:putative ABC transport system substrate-binding protein
LKPINLAVHDSDHIAQTLEELAKEPNTGVIVLPSVMFTTYREIIITTVARLRLPTVYPFSFFAQSGGLLSYGFDVRDMLKRAAGYIDRILRGARVSDLPAQQPTKFELIVNLKAAKALNLTVPPTLVDRADEVIE